MEIDRGYISPQFVNNPERMLVEYENVMVLITDQKIETIKDMIPVLEQVRCCEALKQYVWQTNPSCPCSQYLANQLDCSEACIMTCRAASRQTEVLVLALEREKESVRGLVSFVPPDRV